VAPATTAAGAPLPNGVPEPNEDVEGELAAGAAFDPLAVAATDPMLLLLLLLPEKAAPKALKSKAALGGSLGPGAAGPRVVGSRHLGTRSFLIASRDFPKLRNKRMQISWTAVG